METQSDGVESEQISEAFLCCVCLDILYKPIVLACGHVSCFWCVHRSMSGLRESHCPICRHPYHHFPNICQMLHFLLLKIYPVAYKGRENQILEEEKETGFFSPKVDDLCASHTNEELNHLDDQAQYSSTSKQENLSKFFSSTWKGEPHANMEQPESVAFVQDGSLSIAKQIITESFETNCNENVSTNLSSTRKGESYANMDQPESVAFVQDDSLTIAKQITTESLETNCNGNLSTNLSSTRKGKPYANKEQPESVAYVQDGSPNIAKQITTENFEATCIVGVEDKNLPQISCNRICQQVSIVDVLCAACKQLLFRPAVLNCGHVYCETCIMPAGKAIRCQVCQSPHPRGIPKVCLEFDHFLEEQFPKEYTARRGMVQLKQVQFQHESPPKFCAHGSKVHIGAGCDFCGMYPIIGDRYRCKDCKEAIGFDLCGDCYNTRSKLPGRFNQQHTPDHRFEIVKSNTIRNIMLRLAGGTPRRWLSHTLSL